MFIGEVRENNLLKGIWKEEIYKTPDNQAFDRIEDASKHLGEMFEDEWGDFEVDMPDDVRRCLQIALELLTPEALTFKNDLQFFKIENASQAKKFLGFSQRGSTLFDKVFKKNKFPCVFCVNTRTNSFLLLSDLKTIVKCLTTVIKNLNYDEMDEDESQLSDEQVESVLEEIL